MKPSHYTTPRTMADAVWQPWADPLDFPHERSPWRWRDLLRAVVCVAALALIGIFYGMGVA